MRSPVRPNADIIYAIRASSASGAILMTTIFAHTFGSPPRWSTTFAVDAMFYSAAREARDRAAAATKSVDRAENELAQCQQEIDRLRRLAEAEGKNEYAYHDEIEPLAIQMDHLEHELIASCGPVLRELALAQILSAQSLEAHINIRGETLLKTYEWRAFEQMPLDAKWLFLPTKCGRPGFDAGAEPFQSFALLVKTRNRLVHYKLQKRPYRGHEDPDSFAQKLRLTFEDVDRSISAVKGMVHALSTQLGEDPPRWLESDSSHFFEVSTASQ